jgi:hypothetical protein
LQREYEACVSVPVLFKGILCPPIFTLRRIELQREDGLRPTSNVVERIEVAFILQKKIAAI